MTPLHIVLLVIVSLFTVFNLLMLTVGRKNQAKGRESYNKIMTNLKEKAYADLKGKFSEKNLLLYPYVSDDGHYYMICVDPKKDLMAIESTEECIEMKISTAKTCEIIKDFDGRKNKSIICRVTAPKDFEGFRDFTISGRPHKPNSYFGKFTLEISQEFRTKILQSAKDFLS